MRTNDVNCPVIGHRHKLKLEPDPERPDLVVGKCNDRVVYRAAAYPPTPLSDIEGMTVVELTNLPEWDRVPSPKPTRKSEILTAIYRVRGDAPHYRYQVPEYKE